MEVDEILRHIFGRSFPLGEQPSSFCDATTTSPARKSYCLESVNQWVTEVLDELGKPKNNWPRDDREGRIGPSLVRFDINTHVGLFVVGPDRLNITSQSNFSTIRGNVCLYKGKWQYETQLGTKGVMQIGWATSTCRFSQEIGVGDTINSYAYDGNRVRKWNVSTYKYGEPWISGDIIGCTIDVDEGVLEFYRNGKSLGIAFDNLQMGPGIAYFPAVSLAFTESLAGNFGSTPMQYPVPGFEPIQEPPYHELAQAEQLFKWLIQLLMLFERKYELVSHSSISDGPISNQALLMCHARNLLGRLGPLLTSQYVIEACFMPFLEGLCHPGSSAKTTKSKALPSSNKKPKLLLFLDMMWLFLEERELHRCMESMVVCILAGFRHVSFVLEYTQQRETLLLLTYILQHSQTRQHLLEQVLFDRVRFANFVHMKPLDEGGLTAVVSAPWWDTNEKDRELETNKASYFESCQRIREAIASIEALQVDLLKTLLDNTDGSPTHASSRKIFLRKFRIFLHDSLISNRAMSIHHPPLPIMLCCFHRLLVTFRQLWEREVGEYPIVIPTHIFYDGSLKYLNVDRLGGVLSHLNKTLKEELVKVLGADHPVITPAVATTSAAHTSDVASQITNLTQPLLGGPPFNLGERFMDGQTGLLIPVLTRMLTQQNPASPLLMERMAAGLHHKESERCMTPPGPMDSASSLIELLDGLVMFYHSAAHKQIVKVSTLRDSMTEYMEALADTRLRLEACRRTSTESPAIERELLQTCEVFRVKLSEQARHMAWVRAGVYSPEKQSHLAWLLRVVLQTIKLSSQGSLLFAFLPDFYLETLVESCLALRTHFHPTVPFENIEGYEDLLIEIAEFLCDHFADGRIVHANSKDTMIQALAGFVCRPNTLEALERVPYASRMNMVRSLLRPYENRAWAQSNWVLVRIWQGSGFAFRYQKSPHLLNKLGPKLLQQDSGLISQAIKPCPSLLYQSHVKEIMLSSEDLTTAFLNSLLNQLNWAFSEFIGMLQEIQNVSSRPDRVFIESRQLKICATCFDLALALLRVLEMVVTVAHEIFIDCFNQSSELLLARLCQLLCQVLNRVSSQAGCFQHVVTLEIPDLETVDHFPVLSAVIGILLALLGDEMDEYSEEMEVIPQVSKALITEPSFQVSSLRFVLGDLQKTTKASTIKTFSFNDYTDDVTQDEIKRVEKMICMLESYMSHLSEATILDEDETCTICYAFPIGAKFKPCNHESCRSCIAHHLMNSRICFFCKTPITSVENLDGTILHVLTVPTNQSS